MGLATGLAANGQIAGGTGTVAPSITGALGTALGATKTLSLSATQETWLEGLLSANLTVTVSVFPSGSRAKIIAQQDGTGSRTLTVTVTGGGTTVVPVPALASGAPFEVLIESLDGTAANVVVTLLTSPDASTSQKGAVTLSVAPTTATSPIAVGTNDPRIPAYSVLTANMTAISTQTALQNITGLTVPIGSSATEIWSVKASLVFAAANTTMNLKLGMSFPTAMTARWGPTGTLQAVGWQTVGLAAATAPLALGSETTTPSSKTIATGGLPQGIEIKAILFGGGTAGNMQLQYAQNTSDAGTLQIMAGSMIEYVQIHA